MKYYQLTKSTYNIKKQLHIERLELDNILALEYFTDNIQFLIDSFNKEHQWDDMFDINDVKDRSTRDRAISKDQETKRYS